MRVRHSTGTSYGTRSSREEPVSKKKQGRVPSPAPPQERRAPLGVGPGRPAHALPAGRMTRTER